MASSLSLLDALAELRPSTIPVLTTMESLGQSLGFIAYRYPTQLSVSSNQSLWPGFRKQLAGPANVDFTMSFADRLQVVLNGVVVKTFYNVHTEDATHFFSLYLPQARVASLHCGLCQVSGSTSSFVIEAQRRDPPG